MPDDYRFNELYELFRKGEAENACRLLVQMHSRHIALREELTILKLQNRQLREVLGLSENLFLADGVYWLRSSGAPLGPFCPDCYESDGLLLRLERKGACLRCSRCGAVRGRGAMPPHDDGLPAPERRQAHVLRFAR